jgi:hypothetical protein
VFDVGDFALEVTYDATNITNQTEFILLTDKYEFEAGKQYAINISFGGIVNLIEINFTVDVSDFSDPDDAPLAPIVEP